MQNDELWPFFFQTQKTAKVWQTLIKPKSSKLSNHTKKMWEGKGPEKKGEIKSQKEKMENGKMQPSAIRTDG